MRKTHSGIVNPQKITEARLSRGYNMAETAALAGVTRQAMHRYEQGLSVPSEKVLGILSEKLEFPISFFFNTISLEATSGTTFFRSMKTTESKYRTMIDIRCDWVGMIYLYLKELLNLPQVNLPQTELLLRGDVEALSAEAIEECALLLRRHWKLDEHPIGNLTDLMEHNGIFVFNTQIDNYKLDACHKMIAGRPLVSVTQQKESCCRMRFSLAHELGHMLLHSYITAEDLGDKDILRRIENEANRFASALLLPRDAFLEDVCSSDLNFLLILKRKWKVSVGAIIYRCKDLGIFSEDQITILNRQLSYKRWRTHEPYDDSIPLEQPRLLMTALKVLFDNNVVTKAEFVSTFDLPIKELAQLCNVKQSFFSEEPSEINISIVK